MTAKAILAIDLGGSKLLLALVDGATIIDQIEAATDRAAGPRAWVSQMAHLARHWAGQFDRAGITVTGLINNNSWSALNPDTLKIPGKFALARAAQSALAVPVTLCNDAQAAAWGEYSHGAAQGKNMVFLTISTGVGGGIVLNGHLLQGGRGVAGHFGQIFPLPDGPEQRFETVASGLWIAAQGEKIGLPRDARAVFAAAAAGNSAAGDIVQTSAQRMARLCHHLQLILDPDITVIGGGVGLAPGYIDRMTASSAHLPSDVRPILVRAALGKYAGVIGVADLSTRNQPNEKETT